MAKGSQMSEEDELTEDRMEELESTVRMTTQVTLTPDGEEHGFPEGSMWVYSQGMWNNYGIPDLEMRGVPTSFAQAAGRVINEMNAYRLHHMGEKPFLPDKPCNGAQVISKFTKVKIGKACSIGRLSKCCDCFQMK